jgi:predicted DsbA family dithiol-disulfide isomerase
MRRLSMREPLGSISKRTNFAMHGLRGRACVTRLRSAMRIDVWTDLVCPWCYLGKRRLELALERFKARQPIEIHWRSFELDPDFPRDFKGSPNDLLVHKYGMSLAEAQALHARVTGLAAEDGLAIRFDLARPTNTRDAHRLLQAAVRTRAELAAPLQERLMRAYFTEGASLSDPATLGALAEETGFPSSETQAVLAPGSTAFTREVEADERRAQELGYRGVPAFLFAGKVQLSGAQAPDVLIAALERAERASIRPDQHG